MKLRDAAIRILDRGHSKFPRLAQHALARNVVSEYIHSNPDIWTDDIGDAPDALKDVLRAAFDAVEDRLESNGKAILLSIVQAAEYVLLDTGLIDVLWDAWFKK
jgi:hypothetical protein